MGCLPSINWRRISQPSTVVMLWSFPSIPDVQHRVKFWAVHGRVCHPPWRRLLHWARRSWALRWCPHWNLLKSSVEICWNLLKSIEIWNFEFSKWATPWCSLMFEFRSRPPEDPTRALQTAKAKDRTGKSCINGVCLVLSNIWKILTIAGISPWEHLL